MWHHLGCPQSDPSPGARDKASIFIGFQYQTNIYSILKHEVPKNYVLKRFGICKMRWSFYGVFLKVQFTKWPLCSGEPQSFLLASLGPIWGSGYYPSVHRGMPLPKRRENRSGPRRAIPVCRSRVEEALPWRWRGW